VPLLWAVQFTLRSKKTGLKVAHNLKLQNFFQTFFLDVRIAYWAFNLVPALAGYMGVDFCRLAALIPTFPTAFFKMGIYLNLRKNYPIFVDFRA